MSSTLRLKLAGLMGKIASHYYEVQLKLTSRQVVALRQASILPEKQRFNHVYAEGGINWTLIDKNVLST